MHIPADDNEHGGGKHAHPRRRARAPWWRSAKPLVAMALSALIVSYGVVAYADDPEAAPSDDITASVGKIDWRQCPDTTDPIECGTLEVPLDWANPGGEKIHIGLARHKATDPAKRIGTALMDPGGPGTSGVTDMHMRHGKMFTDAVQERFDVVTYDPRGVGTSSRIICDEKLMAAAEALKTPQSQADFDELVATKKKLSEDCRRRTGALYDHTDTRHTVRDIEAIRIALGEDKITQVGYSYGSIATQLYAETYPQHVRAIVSDGIMDHHRVGVWEWVDGSVGALEENFGQFAAWCDKTPDCALYGRDARKTYTAVRDRARSGTLTDPDTGRKVDFNALTRDAFGANFPDRWRQLAQRIKALSDGGKSTTAPSAKNEGPVAGVAEPNLLPYEVWWCADFRYQVGNYAEWSSMVAKLADKYPTMQWSPYASSGLDCVGYQGETTYPQRRPKTRDAPPMVMVGNVHDFATVYQWAQGAAKDTGATLVTYEGYGHTAYPGFGPGGPSACVNRAVDDYLINLRLPARGTSCAATDNPDAGSGKPVSN